MKKTLVVAAFAAATLASLTAGSASTQAGFGWEAKHIKHHHSVQAGFGWEAGPHKAFGWEA